MENPKHAIKKERTGDGHYLVEIRSKDGCLVDKLEVDQFSDWIHSIYFE